MSLKDRLALKLPTIQIAATERASKAQAPLAVNTNVLDKLFGLHKLPETLAAPVATFESNLVIDFTSKLELLKQMLASEGVGLDAIKLALKTIKEELISEPTKVAEMLPEDIGLLVQALFKTENLKIVEEAKASSKKKTRGPGKQIEIDEDNIPF